MIALASAGMESPSGSPEWLSVHTAAERPDLWEQVRSEQLFRDVWPEYNQHGNHAAAYSGVLPRFADFQVLLVDNRSSRVVARGRSIVPLERFARHPPAGD
jgi:hypothetical protein